MGCVCAKNTETVTAMVDLPQEYSWSSKKKLDPKDYVIEQLTNDVAWKLPGSINGEQFIIQDCSHSLIYIMDHCDSVLIDECDHCKIIIGPTKGSVFIRNVNNSVFMIACGQFRASNCYNMSVFLMCATVATIEAVSGIYLSCYQLHYQNLEGKLVPLQEWLERLWAEGPQWGYHPKPEESNFIVKLQHEERAKQLFSVRAINIQIVASHQYLGGLLGPHVANISFVENEVSEWVKWIEKLEQFRAAGLSVYNNKWSSVYDFTPGPGEANVKIMADELNVEEFFPRPLPHFERYDMTFDRLSSVVPFTYSIKGLDTSGACVLVFIFSSPHQEDTSKLFVRGMQFFGDCKLLNTSKCQLGKKDAANLILSVTNSLADFSQGETVTMVYVGEDVVNKANQVMCEIGVPPEHFKIYGDMNDIHGLAKKFVAIAAFTDS